MRDFSQPTAIDDFPPRDVVGNLMPPFEEIPQEFRVFFFENNRWLKFQADWFFSGIKSLDATPKPGVDKKIALRHLAMIQQSWEPKHEHKQAAVAYLASLWFEDLKYEVAR